MKEEGTKQPDLRIYQSMEDVMDAEKQEELKALKGRWYPESRDDAVNIMHNIAIWKS